MPIGLTVNHDKLRRTIAGARIGAKVAKHMEIHRFSLYRKLGRTSDQQITLEDLNKICAYLNRDVSDFLTRTNNPK